MATFQLSPDLDPKVAQAIRDAMDAVRAELLGHLKPQTAPAATGIGRGDRLTRLEGAVEALDSASTQAGLLTSFLEAAGAFADRCLFLVRDGDDLNGWAAFGFSGGDEAVARVSVACPGEIAAQRPEDNPDAGSTICEALAAPQAADSIIVPFSLRGKVAGALYADRMAGTLELDRPALRILSYVAAQAVETLPLRRAAPEAAEAQPVERGEAKDETAIEFDSRVATAPPPETPAPGMDDTDPDVDVDVERMIEEVEPGSFDEEDDAGIVSIRHDVTPVGFESELEDEADADLHAGRLDTAIDGVERETRQEPEEDLEVAREGDGETLDSDLVDLAGTVEVQPPVRAIEGSEVAPPPDLEGPGWAFSGANSLSEDTRYEEARRLARLLVTEIKLYNEEKVREGREKSDLYAQLRDDIERSRRIYEERIDDEIRQEADYFQEEVVRILAGGDSTALGI